MSVISCAQGMRDEIAARLNEAESDNTDQYTNWINLGLRDITNSFPNAPFLWASADRTLSSGTRVYNNLPSDFAKMNAVVFPGGNVKLSYLTPDEFDMLAPSATAGGNPAVYTLRNTGASSPTIEFFYVPDSSDTVHYDYQATIDYISAGSATVNLPARYLELPILYGEKMGTRRRGLYKESQLIDAEYQSLKEKMIQDLLRQTTENVKIRSIREFQKNISIISDPVRTIFNE